MEQQGLVSMSLSVLFLLNTLATVRLLAMREKTALILRKQPFVVAHWSSLDLGVAFDDQWQET